MEKSLCAHCIHCCEVKYGGFMCDNGGYLENKSVNDGCKYFENDVDKFNDNIKKAKESVITKKKWIDSKKDLICFMKYFLIFGTKEEQ